MPARKDESDYLIKKVRKCLKCGREFSSTGNRLCSKCDDHNRSEYCVQIVTVPKSVQVPSGD